MPIKTREGRAGLLATGEFGDAVLKELPDYSKLVSEVRGREGGMKGWTYIYVCVCVCV